jgi:two-component system, OmpR family, response regulator
MNGVLSLRPGAIPQLRPTVMTSTNSLKRVLIVDDESDICLLLSGLLRRMGYQPTCAHFIEDGRRFLQRQQFDAVFLDLNLPDGIGFDLLPVIKDDQERAKVIMISAFDGMSERRWATEQGADYFIGKPFTRKSVEQALDFVQV